eukprot:CAMPEP_0197923122 /NCGR_PEP_ID=MMETSP1439-20131203/93442_1 /TAXON_ID=66791 /ORGANISM="Gonyaulax spinifera, Strain CCMP409" /LENGTH=47 /DNA_ID= /DNA_START= /DNA_END= /DNA_ORIENTATION=
MILHGLPGATAGAGERHEFQAQFLSATQAVLRDLAKASGERQTACEA